MANLAVLVSGAGTLLDAMIEQGLAITLVVADRTCLALTKAKRGGLPTCHLKRQFGLGFERLAYTNNMVKVLKSNQITHVAMAGFMTVLAEPMFAEFGDRVYNTHPSLLPAFKGARAVEEALAYGVKITGCTIHVATSELDHGPIMVQVPVCVLEGDTVESLHERIKEVERKEYPSFLSQVLSH